jgi:hypothetical protein
MSSNVDQQVVLDAAVRGFLAKYDAEADFARVCELAQASFPVSTGLDVTLQADSEKEGRVQVLLSVTLPDSFSNEQLQRALKQYHARLVEEIPLSHCPLFALVTEFQPE